MESGWTLHHVAIATDDLDAAIDAYTDLTGASVELRADLPEQGVAAAALQVGPTAVELVAPLGDDSPISSFLTRRGPGMHHVAWAVGDLDAALAAQEAAGRTVLPGAGRIGLHGTPVAFLHPASCGGVLTELVGS